MDFSNLPEGYSKEGMMQQAQHVWAMLDDMADRDPAAYRKFIDKQIKEGKEAMEPPQPHMCVQTTMKREGGQEENLFMNVMEWNKMPEPKDDEAPIPVMGSPIYTAKEGNEVCSCVSVAFPIKILQDYGRHSKNTAERRLLINLALDYIEDQIHVKVSRNYTVLNKDITCKGSVKLAREQVMKKVKKDEVSPTSTEDEFSQHLDELQRSFGPMAGSKDSILQELSNIAGGKDEQSEDTKSSPITGPTNLRLPGETRKAAKPLVEEVAGDNRLPEPQYDLVVKETETGGTTCMVARIHIPGVTSVSQCELDIGQDDLRLVVSEQYQLEVSLPQRVDETEAVAKFSRKSCVLTLTIPIISDTES